MISGLVLAAHTVVGSSTIPEMVKLSVHRPLESVQAFAYKSGIAHCIVESAYLDLVAHHSLESAESAYFVCMGHNNCLALVAVKAVFPDSLPHAMLLLAVETALGLCHFEEYSSVFCRFHLHSMPTLQPASFHINLSSLSSSSSNV